MNHKLASVKYFLNEMKKQKEKSTAFISSWLKQHSLNETQSSHRYQSITLFPNAVRISQYTKSSRKKNTYHGVRGQSLDTDRSRFESLRRSKSSITQLVLGNKWDWWCTFTFKESYTILDDAYKAFTKTIKTLKNQGISIQYLVVPEKHKSGSYHFHALINSNHSLFQPQLKNTGKYAGQLYKDKDGRQVYSFLPMEQHGFTHCIQLNQDPLSYVKTASYIANYTTKQKTDEFNKRRFYATIGLSRGSVVSTDKISYDDMQYEYKDIQFKTKTVISELDGTHTNIARSSITPITMLESGKIDYRSLFEKSPEYLRLIFSTKTK